MFKEIDFQSTFCMWNKIYFQKILNNHVTLCIHSLIIVVISHKSKSFIILHKDLDKSRSNSLNEIMRNIIEYRKFVMITIITRFFTKRHWSLKRRLEWLLSTMKLNNLNVPLICIKSGLMIMEFHYEFFAFLVQMSQKYYRVLTENTRQINRMNSKILFYFK